jgi:hypothetical protein
MTRHSFIPDSDLADPDRHRYTLEALRVPQNIVSAIPEAPETVSGAGRVKAGETT